MVRLAPEPEEQAPREQDAVLQARANRWAGLGDESLFSKEVQEVRCICAIERDSPRLEANAFRINSVTHYQLYARSGFELL